MSLADLGPEEWVRRLIRSHDDQMNQLKMMDAYYEGEQPLSYMAPELLRELDDRLQQVVVFWPQLVVDALEERLDVEGFRYSGSTSADAELWRIWQANNLDEESQQAHVDALAISRAFAIIGANESEPDLPVITPESPLDVHAERDPRSRQVMAAVKRWDDPVPDGAKPVEMATLYLPGGTHWFHKGPNGSWVEDDRDEHGLGVVPVVPLVNRSRLRDRSGRTELKPVIPLSNAACKIATDMMVSAEYHSMPRRWATGVSPDDFTDGQGQQISMLSKIVGRVWANEDPDVKVGQFPEASLSNFHDTLNQLARLVASMSGLPPHFLGLATDNPPSADAIRASEARLVKRAERRQRAFGGAWEQVMRLALLVRDGAADPDARSLETLWRDASTPTVAQAADAAVKKHTAGIVPLRQTREDLGYTQTQIERMEAEDSSALTRLAAGDFAALAAGLKTPETPSVGG